MQEHVDKMQIGSEQTLKCLQTFTDYQNPRRMTKGRKGTSQLPHQMSYTRTCEIRIRIYEYESSGICSRGEWLN